MNGGVRIRGVEHTGMIVRDTELLAGWYGETFGASIVSRSPDDPPIIFIGFGGGALLELVPGTGAVLRPTDHIHLSFAVDSLETTLRELDAAGIPLDKPAFRAYDGSPVAFVRDPEGNLIQFVQRVSDFPSTTD